MDTQELRRIVDAHFRVYEERDEPLPGGIRAHLYFLMVDAPSFDDQYEAVRRDILAKDPELLVFVRREGGEDILVVAPRPPPSPQKLRVHALLLLLTILTTMSAGAIWWNTYSNVDAAFWDFATPHNLLWGFITFTVPLMLILGIHESAHFIAAKKHGLRATLPFFLPFPPVPLPIGTLGAFISLKDPLPDRKALFDVGASGPIAGFLVAVPVLVLGMILTNAGAVPIPDMATPEITTDLGTLTEEDIDKLLLVLEDPAPQSGSLRFAATEDGLNATITVTATQGRVPREEVFQVGLAPNEVRHVALHIPDGTNRYEVRIHWEDGLIRFGDPLLVVALDKLGIGNTGYLTHPTFFAGWVGLLITGINLLPAGQLDGGHVARAVFGDRMRYVAYAAIGMLFYLAFKFSSWMLMALFILFMGLNHPPPLNDRTKLDTKRIVLAVGVLVVFALTFVARPIIL